MDRSEAQVYRRRNHPRSEDSVGQLEERVGPAVEALIERLAKGAQDVERIGRFHNDYCAAGAAERPLRTSAR